MYLYCKTTDLTGGCDYARLKLTKVLAKWLLSFRPIFENVRLVSSNLYAIEIFDYEVDYTNDSPGGVFDDDPEVSEGTWFAGKTGRRLGIVEVDVPTVKVTDNGVLWSASPHNGEGYFETPQLSWADLEMFLAGSCPLPSRVPTGAKSKS